MITSDIEDDYFRIRSTSDFNREVGDHILSIARAAFGSKLIDHFIADRDKLTITIFAGRSQRKGNGSVAE